MYEGELWLEIMLVDGINDDEQSILKFQELLKELKYDRLYLKYTSSSASRSRCECRI